MSVSFTESRLPYSAEFCLAALRHMRAGEGVHNELFHAAKAMLPFRTEDQIFSTLQTAVEDCGREVPDREIYDAIRNAHPYVWGRASLMGDPRPAWPRLNDELRKGTIARVGVGLKGLNELSPVKFSKSASEEIIDVLFPANPLLCVGDSMTVFTTKHREDFRGTLTRRQFIVPSPMAKPVGQTKDGRLSPHSLDNTGPRRFAVVEFDTGSADDHAALLWHLRGDLALPLVLAVHSGGKSLHGWFLCQGCPEDQIAAFYRYCVSLGADRATYTRSQFVRMPDGLRDGKVRQSVQYFDPARLKGGSK